ncbi:serine acetyltransferase [Flavobacterium sp.]|uniref:serine acetyltransferase n=1 Tax=Flavobacterium sp. TaxID=239 RepID=UPI0040485F20
MIQSKKELNDYIASDRKANGFVSKGIKGFIDLYFVNEIAIFLFLLRKSEYYKNKSGLIPKCIYLYYKIRFRKKSLKLGFSIPENVFGPGLAIPHYGTIVVNANAKVGSNCRIHVCTNIGASSGNSSAPIIGDNVYIGPGAKIYGDIIIGNNIAIAANAAVNKSFSQDGVLIGGVPAKVINDDLNIKKIIKHI